MRENQRKDNGSEGGGRDMARKADTNRERDKDRSQICQKQKMDCGMFPSLLCVYDERVCVEDGPT